MTIDDLERLLAEEELAHAEYERRPLTGRMAYEDARDAYAQAAVNALPELLVRLRAAEAALRNAEWSGDADTDGCQSCRSCYRWEWEGHAPACGFAVLLTRLRAPLGAEG